MNIFERKLKKTNPHEKTIFIVEDNEVYAKALQGFLITRFPDIHNIKIYPFGEACLMDLYQNPTVIIMDHLLNTKNRDAATGLSIIKKIKTASSDSNIILLSAQKEFDVVSKAISKYGCTYLQKDEHSFSKVEKLVKMFFHNEMA
ncbi:MAG: response regulator [Bacteroidetes bacterium]|nr:response regulator [Bacteroidota bacterium]